MEADYIDHYKNVERVLLNLCFSSSFSANSRTLSADETMSFTTGIKESTVVLDVEDICGWVIKFRAYGVILNNIDLINQDLVDIDAKLMCTTSGFWTLMNGGISISDAVNKKIARISGSIDIIEHLLFRLITTTEHGQQRPVPSSNLSYVTSTPSSVSTAQSAAVVSGPNDSASVSLKRCHSGSRDRDDFLTGRFPTIAGVGGGAGISSSSPNSRTASGAMSSPVLAQQQQQQQPLRSGWLLKKRDVWNGWRCRYFVLYPGKLLYFTDQHDTQPKAVISLAGAEVYAAKRCTISGNPDHWYLVVEPVDPKEDKLRLASELSGEEGHLDTSLWVKDFLAASRRARTSASASGSIGGSGEGSELLASTPVGRRDRPSQGQQSQQGFQFGEMADSLLGHHRSHSSSESSSAGGNTCTGIGTAAGGGAAVDNPLPLPPLPTLNVGSGIDPLYFSSSSAPHSPVQYSRHQLATSSSASTSAATSGPTVVSQQQFQKVQRMLLNLCFNPPTSVVSAPTHVSAPGSASSVCTSPTSTSTTAAKAGSTAATGPTGSMTTAPVSSASAAAAAAEYTVLLVVNDIGAWFIKFRPYGTIVNNRDLVNQDCIDIDATLSCSTSGFWTIVNGGIQVQDALKSQLVKISGSLAAVEVLWQNLIIGGSVVAPCSARGIARVRTESNILMSSGDHAAAATGGLTPSKTGGLSPTQTQLQTISSAQLQAQQQQQQQQQQQPLRSGWLLKKRDVWNGWRCRYFVLYPGKLLYFTDQHDTQPKAVISLAGAEVYAAKRCTISGNPDHWYLVVEPADPKEDKLRLASELSGEEGHLDTSLWVKDFLAASRRARTSASASGSIGGSGENFAVAGINASGHYGSTSSTGDYSGTDQPQQQASNRITAAAESISQPHATTHLVTHTGTTGCANNSTQDICKGSFLSRNLFPIAVSVVCLLLCGFMLLDVDGKGIEAVTTGALAMFGGPSEIEVETIGAGTVNAEAAKLTAEAVLTMVDTAMDAEL